MLGVRSRSFSTIFSRARNVIFPKEIEAAENAAPVSTVERHGKGDSCVTLNVGGKEFVTLRSTVESNSVLALHVARAEANKEITKDGAVFIDRDPQHFGFILAYLRNRLEDLDASKLSAKTPYVSMGSSLTTLHIPKDNKTIGELYTEATFYNIAPLKANLCSHSYLASLVGIVNKNASNPFVSAAKWMGRLRTALFAAGGTMMVTLQDDLDWALKKVGLRDDGNNDKDSEEKTIVATQA